MKILIACEFSGIVREAFRRRGHDTVSCDLLPTEIPGPHYQGDVFDIINNGWDMMIAFPPCTDLASSGARWFAEKRADGRQQKSIDFFMRFIDAPIPQIAVENPIGIMSSLYRKPDQIIHPWMFGHGETKSTCLWLKDLPLLEPTDIVVPEWAVRADGTVHISAKGKKDNPTHYLTGRARVLSGVQRKQWERIHRMPPGPERWKDRSRTFQGIAEAMAEQWNMK